MPDFGGVRVKLFVLKYLINIKILLQFFKKKIATINLFLE